MTQKKPAKARRSGWQIYRPALALGGLSLLGLGLALLGDGLYDLASWVILGATLASMPYFWNRPS
ncbi:hypothetical protein MTR62_07545 [Novosphingobium sp. 1949]|uniref:Uncharacterized protein n=1 Tax=Novosphingobium organovorum TaxID=2930092 RepID=A0ABT0BBW7_9SPHN|nr:hypothetical protein [Novosphingobium organovorum]MCJ2182545.1 hypothetical protein [Novosphingobium organovorum]